MTRNTRLLTYLLPLAILLPACGEGFEDFEDFEDLEDSELDPDDAHIQDVDERVGVPEWMPPAELLESLEMRTGWYAVEGKAVEVEYQLLDGEPTMGGDIALDPGRLFDDPDSATENDAGARSATVRDRDRLWPNGRVPYTLGIPYGARIRRGLDHWKWETSLTFEERNAQNPQVANYIRFVPRPEGGGNSALGRVGGEQLLKLGTHFVPDYIVGIGIDPVSGHVFSFHTHSEFDARPSFLEGYSRDLDLYTSQNFPSKPKSAGEEVDISLNGVRAVAHPANQANFVMWWADGTRTVGPAGSPGGSRKSYSVAAGKSYSDLVAVGMQKVASTHTFAYYEDGTFSEGYSRDLDYYENASQPLRQYSLSPGYEPSDIIAMDFSKSDKPVTFFADGYRIVGTDPANLWNGSAPALVSYRGTTGMDTVIHEVGHAIGLYHEHQRADRDEHVDVLSDNIRSGMKGNFKTYNELAEKKDNYDGADVLAYNFDSIMHYSSSTLAWLPGVYTIVSSAPNTSCGLPSLKICPNVRLTALDVASVELLYDGLEVGKGIAKSDQDVYSWYRDGIRTHGDIYDPTKFDQIGAAFSLPYGAAPHTVVGTAINWNDRVYMWHANKTRSYGTSKTQSASTVRSVTYPSGYAPDSVVDMAIFGAQSGHVYTFFDDQKFCEGWSRNLCAYAGPEPYTLPAGYSPDDILGMDFLAYGFFVLTWYKDSTWSLGYPDNLVELGHNTIEP